jgi:hypothetical protein
MPATTLERAPPATSGTPSAKFNERRSFFNLLISGDTYPASILKEHVEITFKTENGFTKEFKKLKGSDAEPVPLL